jgi:hypothetical protein
MRKEKYLGLSLFIVFLPAGAYFLQDSISDSSHYAEVSALVGALLSALALAAMSWSIKVHLLTKALRRHMRGR